MLLEATAAAHRLIISNDTAGHTLTFGGKERLVFEPQRGRSPLSRAVVLDHVLLTACPFIRT